jgi:hypothetical protein
MPLLPALLVAPVGLEDSSSRFTAASLSVVGCAPFWSLPQETDARSSRPNRLQVIFFIVFGVREDTSRGLRQINMAYFHVLVVWGGLLENALVSAFTKKTALS